MWPRSFETLESRRLLSGSPAISITDVTSAEGEGGATAYTFTVALSKASSKRVSVNFATADGSAVAGSDYVARAGTLTFARGETTKSVTVLVNGDATVEGDETFVVNLSQARNAFLADGRGIGTIVNDDALPPPPPATEPPPYEQPVEPSSSWDPTYTPVG